MTTAATILLTAPDPALVAGLTSLRPGLCVIALDDPLGPSLPQAGGPMWAFVDWLLPDLSGLELCRRLREAEPTRAAHLTMVLEGADADARRRALAAGADDYIVGPLTPERVVARVEGIAPEQGAHANGQRLRHGELVIDPAAFQARYQGRVLPLRPNELRLLVHFITHPDQVFSRAGLIRHLGKDGDAIDERTVDVWIGRLRRGLRAHGAPDPLRTVRSLGYVLDSPQA